MQEQLDILIMQLRAYKLLLTTPNGKMQALSLINKVKLLKERIRASNEDTTIEFKLVA